MQFDFAHCKQKGFSGMLLILVVLLLLGGGLYLITRYDNYNTYDSYNNYDNYKNYDIYSNQALGFQFDYEKGLAVKQDSEEEFNKRGNGNFRKNFKGYIGYEPEKFVGAVAVLDQDNSFDKNPFTVWIFNNDSNLTIQEWYEQYWYYPFVWGDFTKRREGVGPQNIATVSGTVAYFGIVDYSANSPKFVYLTNNGKMFLFRIIGEEGDKILASFKFIN